MTLVDRITSWFTRPPRMRRIETALTRIETALLDMRFAHAVQGFTLRKLTKQGDIMAVDLKAVEAATARVEQAGQRIEHEIRELASKLLAPDGAEQLAVVAGRLNALADSLNATTAEVDTDNSSPAVEA